MEEYTYDNNGNQLTMTDSTGTTTRTYDELNRVLTKTVPDMGTSIYAYDIKDGIPAGCWAETSTDPKGHTTQKGYDRVGCRFQSYLSVEFQPSMAIRSEHFPNCMTF